MGEVGSAGVDAWELATTTAKVPAHHAHLDPGLVHLANQGAPGSVLQWGGEGAGEGGQEVSSSSNIC